MENITAQVFTNTNETVRLGFEKATEVTTDPWFFTPLIIYSALVIVIYLIWGGLAENPQGKKIATTNNFLVFLLLLVFFLAIGILLTIFPVYLKFFS